MSESRPYVADLEAALGNGLLSSREEGDGFVLRVRPESAHETLRLLKGRGFNLLVDLTAVDWSAASPEAELGVVGRDSLGGASFVPPGSVGSPAPEATSATSISTRSENHQSSPNSSSPESDSVRLGSADPHGKEARFEIVYRLAALELGTGLVRGRVSVKTRLAESEPCPRTVMDLYPCADWFEREVWDMFGVAFTDRPGIKRLLMYEEFKGHPLRKDYPIAKRQPLIGPAAGEPTRNPSFNHAFPTVTPDDE